MPHCPHCEEEVDSINELQTDIEKFEKGTMFSGTVMYSCPACGAILGMSAYESRISPLR